MQGKMLVWTTKTRTSRVRAPSVLLQADSVEIWGSLDHETDTGIDLVESCPQEASPSDRLCQSKLLGTDYDLSSLRSGPASFHTGV